MADSSGVASFRELETLIDQMIRACDGKVTLHLYFGDNGRRTDEIKNAEQRGRRNLFENW